MRLPFVPREMYEAEHARVQGLEQRLADLMDGYTALHNRLLDALTHTSQPSEPRAMPERPRDEVIDAILARSGNNGLIRQHLSTWAASQRRGRVPDEQIIEQIMNWESDNEENDAAH